MSKQALKARTETAEIGLFSDVGFIRRTGANQPRAWEHTKCRAGAKKRVGTSEMVGSRKKTG